MPMYVWLMHKNGIFLLNIYFNFISSFYLILMYCWIQTGPPWMNGACICSLPSAVIHGCPPVLQRFVYSYISNLRVTWQKMSVSEIQHVNMSYGSFCSSQPARITFRMFTCEYNFSDSKRYWLEGLHKSKPVETH